MMINLRTRGILALLIMLAFVLSSSLLFLKSVSVPDFINLNRDRISLYEKRFDGLRKMLPARGGIGYVSDVPVGLNAAEIKGLKKDLSSEDSRKYFKKVKKAKIDYARFQYVVSPLVVSPDSAHPLLVGNFSNSDIDYWYYIADNFILVEDFGNGVMLFEDSAR